MKKLFFLITLVIFVVNPVVSQTKEEKKAEAEKRYEAMKVLINTGAFEFVGEWAISQRGMRINLISNPTFIKMDAKNADGYLPFFGTAQVAGYGQGGAIEFNGEVENYSLVFNDKKQRAIIKFDINGKTNENFDVLITVYENLNASISVSGTYRSMMSYTGIIKPLEKKEEENKQ